MNVVAIKPADAESAEEQSSSSGPQAAKVNILVVDDLPEKLLVYETILEELDQTIMTARSGEEALKLVLKHEFAVILLDVNMPGMDGYETASLIRSRRKSSRTPIIFLTAFTDEINIAQGYASGAVDYLPTPVVPEVLKAKIRVFIELFQMRQQAARQAEERARREAAEEADRRKDEFLATLAHELRNPLAPLHNALYVLQTPNVKPEMITAACQMMRRQLDHMVRLVDDLMDISRITRGKIDLRLENITLAKAIENALDTAGSLIRDRGHRLTVEMPTEIIRVKGDMVRLSQVFTNLLNNAAKYTDPGGALAITVTHDSETVSVSVHDSGIGIPRERLEDIFDLFMQIDNSISRAQGGLGIGLTLVKNLVLMHGGTVEAKSGGLGGGSIFTVSLPISEIVRVEDGEQPAKPFFRGHRACRALIVDDNEASAMTMGWMLESMGYEIRVAYEGKRAIETAREFLPELVFLDIGMPGMNGYEICEALRREPDLARTVFVAQTGWGQDEHRRRSKEAGFDHHLVKPVHFEALGKILKTIA